MKISITNEDKTRDLLCNADILTPGETKAFEFESALHIALYRQPPAVKLRPDAENDDTQAPATPS